jgi:hypothetical protein
MLIDPSTSGQEAHVNSEQCSAIINDLRAIAETIRSHTVQKATGMVIADLATIPLRLHVAAAILESEMRQWAVNDQHLTSVWKLSAEYIPRTSTFPLTSPNTTMAPTTVSREVSHTELAAARRDLHHLTTKLPNAFNTTTTPAILHHFTVPLHLLDDYLARN